ncbi:MAG: hypothetical protein QOI83_2272, partial [Streptomycetaceae bacterium]|nr:hypothetical protein [Streptomycetaceae bacterium]
GAHAAALDLVTTAMALAQSLWQIAHPPRTLAKLYREDAGLAHADTDFGPSLTRLLHACVLGLITTQGPAAPDAITGESPG